MIILIADDEPSVRTSLNLLLAKDYETILCADGVEALEKLKETSVDLVITDNQMPGMTGLELIQKGKELFPSTAFILMTAFGNVEQAVQAIRLGAEDYVMKPFEFSEMVHRIERIAEIRDWRIERVIRMQAASGLEKLIGRSPSILHAKEFIVQVAPVNSPVLLLGESGTGKEVVAQAIHECGPRAPHPFITVNCASLNEQLIESDLFGHEKGSFSGAIASRPGKFELAKSGTLFLDEIGELSPGLQAKLLRVIQEKEFSRVGGIRQIKSAARIIAATHRCLEERVKTGEFRQDLFFRMNVLSLCLTPLRERRQDIPSLIDFFWLKLSREMGRNVQLSGSARDRLLAYAYPGNVRELQNVLERLLVLSAPNSAVEVSALPPEIHPPSPSLSVATVIAEISSGFEALVDNYERQILEQAMVAARGNQIEAGKILKLSRGALQYKLKKARLTTPEEEEKAA